MRVFITGASGHIGSAVVPELLAAGHQIVGLARSDAAAAALSARGAAVWRGDLDDLEGLRRAAADADGVIHLAFKHEVAFSGNFEAAIAAELRAVEAMAASLEGKPFVTTSGTLTLAHTVEGRLGTEEDPGAGPRVASEEVAVTLGKRGVRASAVRLSPTVHSSLDHHGFIPMLVGMAKKNGFAAYVGDGANRWPAVHTLDAARLYRLALEAAPAGAKLHGVADEGVPFRSIAEAIGRGLGLPARSVASAEAPKYLSFLAMFAQLDNPTSSARTRELLGWQPTHPGLLADLGERHYFEPAQAKR